MPHVEATHLALAFCSAVGVFLLDLIRRELVLGDAEGSFLRSVEAVARKNRLPSAASERELGVEEVALLDHALVAAIVGARLAAPRQLVSDATVLQQLDVGGSLHMSAAGIPYLRLSWQTSG